MQTYKQFITESNDVVAHLEHIEDYVLNGGVAGTRQAINYLRDIRDTLAGRSKGKINATIKYDGAPSLFAGIDPTDGKFFVAKKGIFNKNPKVYKTAAEVHADTSGDLADKLALALKYLPATGIKGIVQGDFMFSHSDLKKVTIMGEDFLTFHPNTIVYAVPLQSVLAKQMLAAKIGVVWHTKYTGKDFASLKAEGGAAISKTMKKSANVWFDDVLIRDLSGTVNMTQAETDEVTDVLSELGSMLQRATPATLNDISSDPDFLIAVKTYHNSKIRAGDSIPNPTDHVRGLVSWLTDRFQKERDSKKTEKGKLAVDGRRVAMMRYFGKHGIGEIARIFEMMNLIVTAKNILVSKLNRINGLRTFLKTKDGFQVTGQEGYVITDHLGKNAVKLVDRLEFSRANFSNDFVKGWQR
jgi:hypothetical protein